MLSISQAASQIGVSPVTLRRWEKKELITPLRTPGNHRRYSLSQVFDLLKSKNGSQETNQKEPSENSENISKNFSEISPEKAAIYARVSQPIQKKNGDLDRQIERLKAKIKEDKRFLTKIYSDVGSGLNDKRKSLIRMFSDSAKGKFRYVYVTYPDRLSRFCVSYLERHLGVFNIEVIYTDTPEQKSFQEELTSDLMAIIMSFGGKLHGMRARKNAEREKERIPELSQKLIAWAKINKISAIDFPILKKFFDESGEKLMKRFHKRLMVGVNDNLIQPQNEIIIINI